MVTLLRVRDAFHARVVVARLGSEGIVAQLRGADGPYPMGVVEVLVLADELEAAQALLLADEVESAFADVDADEEDDEDGGGRRSSLPRWAVACVVALVVLFAVSELVSPR
jgi:hypothetical protein